MLVMVRWNIELPRLMPLLIESLRQETGKSTQEISKQMMIVEDRPGLYFGANDNRTIYPVLVMLKNKPFTNSEINLVNEKTKENSARVFAIPGVYTQPPYDKLLMDSSYSELKQEQLLKGQDADNENIEAIFKLKPPTDDSPFFFAREKIPGPNDYSFGNSLICLRCACSAAIVLFKKIQGASSFLVFLLVTSTLCNIYRARLYGYRNNIYPEIPSVVGNSNNGFDSHTVFHSGF